MSGLPLAASQVGLYRPRRVTGVVVRPEKIDELPGHVCRSVGRQEQRRPGDILRLRPFGSGVGRDLAGGHIGLDPSPD